MPQTDAEWNAPPGHLMTEMDLGALRMVASGQPDTFILGRKQAAKIVEVVEAAHSRIDVTQKFFDDYAAQARKPHFGPVHREVILEILKRAQEQGLYTPKE